MQGEIITIGNELVSGRTIDLNSWYAAGRLTASGLKVTGITTVGDEQEKVAQALRRAMKNSGFVIVTGGLGSTEDDMTCEIVADALDRPLCLDKKMYGQIKRYVDSRGIEMSKSLEKMAWMPEGSKILHPKGAMCGFSLMEEGALLYFLPGIPDQMRYLMDRYVLPEILMHAETLPVFRQRMLKVYGLSEPSVAEMLRDLSKMSEKVVLGFYPHFPENHITISLRGRDEPSVVKELDVVEEEIKRLLGACVFASGPESMEEVVGGLLREKGLTLATAESCTGGLIGNLLTNVPGSSSYFMGGVVAYSNESKASLLGVSRQTLARHGAVSDQTVCEMTVGIRERLRTDLGLAVTGIAGPEGGTRAKPVGTVHIGLATTDDTLSGKYRFWGTRHQVKLNTAMMALDWIRRYLYGHSFIPGL
ncbi:MAG: competence/damage-inducible protein A [Deltaproteobacteria bacterium]|nr:competence/damage-inducible protein A [Deltaproteobacteria bacterium]MBW2138180.1 competence/damage-inducible protein A [Deltaproteobacteria bacterium]